MSPLAPLAWAAPWALLLGGGAPRGAAARAAPGLGPGPPWRGVGLGVGLGLGAGGPPPRRGPRGRRLWRHAAAGGAVGDRVGDLLDAIEGCDRGIGASDEERARILSGIAALEAAGQGRDYFEDGSVFGRYEVSYVGANSSRIANPAGGRWRGRVGRLLCPSQGLYQHVLRDDADPASITAVNCVEAALLGLLPITVVLRGSATRLSAAERARVAQERGTPGGLTANAVRADFEAPCIAVGPRSRGGLAGWIPPLRLRAGPRSSVVLDAPYVDERVRIGKGASGIRFVLRRTEAPGADSWRRAVAGRALGARAGGALLLLAGALRAVLAARRARGAGAPWAACGAAAPWALLAALGLACCLSSGGIVRGQPRRADYAGQGYSPVLAEERAGGAPPPAAA